MDDHVQSISFSFTPLIMAHREMADGSAVYSDDSLTELLTEPLTINLEVAPTTTLGSLLVEENNSVRAFSVKPERCATASVITDSGRYNFAVTNTELVAWFKGESFQGEFILINDGKNYKRYRSVVLPTLVVNAISPLRVTTFVV